MTSGLLVQAQGGVVINEFMAGSSDRRLSWSTNDSAQLGSGVSWKAPEYVDSAWSTGNLPAGYGFTGLSTDLTSAMSNQAPTLYLRKEFQVTAEQASATNQLHLTISCNDGFVAYINGREFARANCGPTNHFMYACQAAYNVGSGGNLINLGPASRWLVPGRNVLAIEAHNAEQPSTVSLPEQITQHLPTPEFRINAGLSILTSPLAYIFIVYGNSGGPWQYFVGRYEPSGGVVDEGLITNTFTAPQGEEGDYDQPSAFVDWVELYNNGSSSVDLTGWSLTDDAALPAKWYFPANTTIPANGFLLVLCDDRNEANAPAGPAWRIHSNFKLGRKGEYLGLFSALGAVVDQLSPTYPPQVFYCSYGRNPTNTAQFGYFDTATPGTINGGTFYPAQVVAPQFKDAVNADLPGGLYSATSLTLQLLSPTPGSVVRYTLDGSEPTLLNGSTYSSALSLSQSNDKIGTVIRARAFLAGWLPSDVVTHSYILKQPAALTNVPVLMLTADAGRDFYKPRGIMAIAGGTWVGTYSGNIWQAGTSADYNNAEGDGYPFERATHFEFYFPTGYYPTNQAPVRDDIGLRMSGSDYQRPRYTLQYVATDSPWNPWNSFEKPSFNIHFNSDYGSDPLDYVLFTNYPVHKFQHLRLRAGKNDNYNPFITDELVRRLWIDLGHVGARGLFCSMYMNAVYKGVFNLTERIREPFFQQHYGSDALWDVNYSWNWVDGDATAFYQLLSTLDTDLTVAANWQSVTNQMDIDNIADYYLLNTYCAMWDWPGNNFVIARERSTGSNSRFRFAVWTKEILKVHFIEAFGRIVAHFFSDLYDQVAFVGEVLSELVKALSRPRSIRWKDVWLFIEKAGADAVPLVILTGFLIGVIMAFQSALPLRQMGSDVYVANVVAFTILRELGPLITAIILAGRTGSAIAAEIGTMKIHEEIDALTTMGFKPIRFLVISRILGILFLAPLLTIVCDFFGMLGGAVVFRSLGYSAMTYINQIITVVTLRDIFGGLAKAYPFAIAVAVIGCLRGMQTKTGASAVGESTTSAVVTGMVTIIILDGLIAAIYYVLGV